MKDYEDMQYFHTAERLVDAIVDPNDSRDFYRIVVNYYLSCVASMMRATVVTPHADSQQVMMYAIPLAPSGVGKGRSTSIMENQVLDLFKHNFMSYTMESSALSHFQIEAARRCAKHGGQHSDEIDKVEAEYHAQGPMAFSFGEGSGPAIRQLRHKCLLANAGALNLKVDEIGRNFIKIQEAIDIFLELFDGKAEIKILKQTADSKRLEDLKGKTPANVLLFGDPGPLLAGGKVTDEFMTVLATGYARRSFFCYETQPKPPTQLSAQELLDFKTSRQSNPFLDQFSDQLAALSQTCPVGMEIQMPDNVALIFTEYEIANQHKAAALGDNDTMRKTEINGRDFKAIRLAGAYAFIDGTNIMTEDHAYAAIKLAEDSGNAFKKMLARPLPHEALAKYIVGSRSQVNRHNLTADLSTVFKGSVQQKEELISLAIAYGYSNNMLIKKSFTSGVEHFTGEALESTDLSRMIVSWSTDIAKDYNPEVAQWDQLHKMTNQNGIHWCSHHFKNGMRRDEDATPGFNMIVLDIDDGTSLEMAKELLKDYKALFYTTPHHGIAKKGQPACDRYRILIPTNYVLKLNQADYKAFSKNLFDWLPFKVDESTGQRNRKWVSHDAHYEYTDGQLLDVLPFIPNTTKNEEFAQKQLDMGNMDNLERWVVSNSGDGNRNNMLLRFAMMLVDSGADFGQIASAVADLNAKLDSPLDADELSRTILKTVSRKLQTQVA